MKMKSLYISVLLENAYDLDKYICLDESKVYDLINTLEKIVNE